MAQAVLLVGLLLLLATLCTAFFERTRVPDVLALILVGVVLGPALGWVQPTDFGRVGTLASTITLVVILFESGVSLSLKALTASIRNTLGLTLAHFGMAIALVGFIAHYLIGVPPLLALFLGAALGGTSAAVVIPMVKTLGMREEPGTVLVLESALTDVLCIVVAFGFLEAASSGLTQPARVLGSIVVVLLFAIALGGLAAVLWLAYLETVKELPNQIFTMLACLFILYGVAELMGFSGGIAAFSFGFVITSYRELRLDRLKWLSHLESHGPMLPPEAQAFLLEVVFALKTFFFVYLGLSIMFGDLPFVGLAAGTMLALLAGRTLAVLLTVRAVSSQEAALMAVMTPKGLAPAVLAAIPLSRGLEGAETLEQFTYMVVLSSVVFTSVLVPLLQTRPVRWASRLVFRRCNHTGMAQAD